MLATALSDPIWPDWLPNILMIAGVLILGVLAGLMVRDQSLERQPRDEVLPGTTLPPIGASGDTHASFSSMVDGLETAISQLDEAAIITQQRLNRIERHLEMPAQRVATAHEALPRPKPVAVSELKPIEASPDEAQIGAARFADSVFALSDAGHPPIEIAHQLGEHIGKVELVLALRNCKSQFSP